MKKALIQISTNWFS